MTVTHKEMEILRSALQIIADLSKDDSTVIGGDAVELFFPMRNMISTMEMEVKGWVSTAVLKES